ncbi:MAG TPA: YbaK/EbsC family protein [Acidimicrobiia bacterium]|nr:YbaK/EbsC family protein [Acidimicrobiia bacterium]
MALLHPKVERQLHELGVIYDVMDCDPEFADTAAFCEKYGVDPADSANTILVASKRPPDVFGVCVALATTRLDVNRAVRDALGVKKLSFAPADVTLAVTGMEIGGVTPFGLAADLPILVDAAVMERPEIVLGGGNRTSKLRLAPSQLVRLDEATVIDGLAAPLS